MIGTHRRGATATREHLPKESAIAGDIHVNFNEFYLPGDQRNVHQLIRARESGYVSAGPVVGAIVWIGPTRAPRSDNAG
jgi:hypothetical protein